MLCLPVQLSRPAPPKSGHPWPYRITTNGAKFAAGIMLAGSHGFVIPSREEWIGLNMMDRDDELHAHTNRC